MPGSARQNDMFDASPVKQYVQRGNPLPVTSCGRRRLKPGPLFKADPPRTIGKGKNFNRVAKDKNEINEKNVVGFISFVVMCLFAIADLVTSFIFVGEEAYLVINEVIYNSFVWVTLGCFGISSFEKVKKK